LENELGMPDNPLKITWLEGTSTSADTNSESFPEASNSTRKNTVEAKPSETPYPTESTISDKDYESVVLMKLRQFEERKRLIREMQEDDEQ